MLNTLGLSFFMHFWTRRPRDLGEDRLYCSGVLLIQIQNVKGQTNQISNRKESSVKGLIYHYCPKIAVIFCRITIDLNSGILSLLDVNNYVWKNVQ